MSGCRCIAREISESAYSWDSEGDGKRELACVGDKVDYHKRRLAVYYTHKHTHTHPHPHTHTHTHTYIFRGLVVGDKSSSVS